MQRILIADSSASFVSALEAALDGQFLVRACSDGGSALQLLEQFQPDVLIINLMLPYVDGLTVLQHTPFRPHIVLVVTPCVNSYIQYTLGQLGVDYTMISPSVNLLCLRLQDLILAYAARSDSDDPLEAAIHHLHRMNFASGLDGYQQLCAAIALFSLNPEQIITKELYPAVARQCGCKDGSCVERSIRKAIRTAWEGADMTLWRKYFPPGPRGRIPCPTNKEFICRLAELINTR